MKKLIQHGHEVLGLDNINDYYDLNLKFGRLNELGIDTKEAVKFNYITVSKIFPNTFKFIPMDLEDSDALPEFFNKEKFDVVCPLAAQAKVRFNLKNPEAWFDSNIFGFF